MPLIRKGPNETAPGSGADTDAAFATLRAGSPEERWAAARALATVPGAPPVLGHALDDEKDRRVREAIFTSLVRIGSAESVEAVLPHLRSDDANLRAGALDALKAMPAVIRTRLGGLLHDADQDVRILACELARDVPQVEAMTLLLDVIETDTAANVCAAAVEVLAEIGSPDALPALVRCAQRFPDQPFLSFAVRVAVERIGSQSLPGNG
jgi:HEAT repeat protein